MTQWSEVVLVVLVVLLLLGLWAMWYARRLDRLHRKVLASRLALDAQLLRRATSAGRLASGGYLDPVTTVLVLAALDEAADTRETRDVAMIDEIPDLVATLGVRPRREGGNPSPTAVARGLGGSGVGPERVAAENGLSLTLREVLADPGDVAALYEDPECADLLDDLAVSWYRSQLARRFHNESVAQVQLLRRRLVVRALHLAGHAPLPQSVDLDDAWPVHLRAPDGAVTS